MFFEFRFKDRLLKRTPEIESAVGFIFLLQFNINDLHVKKAPIPEVLTN